MFALPVDVEPGFFQRLDRAQVIYAGQLGINYAVITSISRISQRVSGSP